LSRIDIFAWLGQAWEEGLISTNHGTRFTNDYQTKQQHIKNQHNNFGQNIQ
jgi:hypothetical protein